MEASAIILAAGAGTRMKSKTPKVAHRIMSEPLVAYVIAAVKQAVEAERLVAVVGHQREVVEPLVAGDCQVVVQEQQRGTADAVNSCREAFAGMTGSVAVLSGKESEAELMGLNRDIFSYNGLGCRNISLIFLPAGIELTLNPPKPNPMMQGNYAHNKALKTMLGIPFTDLNGYLAVESNTFSNDISQINYCYYNSVQEVEEWLKEYDEELQCIVSNIISHPRRVSFGRAQYPTLWDVADGVDVMNFLTQQ
jgi:CTP:phosphocholine cytidylyltransferase-like protein